jgi:hypothetical protein
VAKEQNRSVSKFNREESEREIEREKKDRERERETGRKTER